MNTDIHELERRVGVSAGFWRRIFEGLTLATYRDQGEAALHDLFRDFMTAHQGELYLIGLQKLGIHPDEPPAVKAAKYHFLSNQLGGLRMEYVEESPKKVWIRYLSPDFLYRGMELLAVPESLGRTIYSTWHPRNGELMGCPRLGWVATKFVSQGDPYDEGYFIEEDHDLGPDEVMRFERVDSTPEYDPDLAPKLDPVLWPRERILKAEANYVGGYVADTLEAIRKRHGDEVAWRLLEQTMRVLAIQCTKPLREHLGISGSSLRDATGFCTSVLHNCFQSFSVDHLSTEHERIQLETFKPFDTTAPEALRDAWFSFHSLSTRLINGRIRVTRSQGPEGNEIWDFVDTGRWLY